MEFEVRKYWDSGGTIVNVCVGCWYEDRGKPRTSSGAPPCLHPEAPDSNPVHGCPRKVMR